MKISIKVIVTGAALLITLFVVLHSSMQTRPSLSLMFQRYGTQQTSGQTVAFLWLTNTSESPHSLAMTGNTNTLEGEFYLGRYSQSYMVNCEFKDKTPDAWKVWTDSFPPGSQAAFLLLEPHSGILIRVPVPQHGQKRNVTVLCQKLPGNRSSFLNRFVLDLLRSTLPSAVLVRVSCEHELACPL
jgi:hypothetical protein